MKNQLCFQAEPFEAYSEFDEVLEVFDTDIAAVEWEDEFRLASLPSKVREAFDMGPLAWPLAVQRAIAAGRTNADDLANLVFFMHHPERLKAGVGAALKKSEPNFSQLAKEWKAWKTLILPLLPAGGSAPSSSPSSGTQPGAVLRYGVANGKIGSPFDQHRSTKAYTGYHLGIDVSPYKGNNKGADDPRRGLAVYFTPKLSFTKNELDTVKIAAQKSGPITQGLGVPSRGNAVLEEAEVIRRGSYLKKDHAYGSHVGIACVYAYPKVDGSSGRFTLYIEYLHLITKETLPVIHPDGTTVSMAEWIAAGKGNKLGFGPRMIPKMAFSREELASASAPPLVGYLGATVWPHVHIQVAFSHGRAKKYIRAPRVDPASVIL